MAASLSILLLAVATVVFIYNLLHFLLRRPAKPLPPGPRPWPLVGNLPHLGAVPRLSLAALSRTYGPLMHLKVGSADVMVASSASVAAQFLKTHDVNFLSRPPVSGAKHIAYNQQDLMFGPRWRTMRKIISVHLFSGKAMNDFQHIRQEEVSILTRVLARAGPEPVKIWQRVNLCTANALSRVMTGRRLFGYGSGGDGAKGDEFNSLVEELMVLAGLFNVGDFIPALDWMDLQGVATKMKRLHQRFDAFLTAVVEEQKVARGAEGHVDMLTTLLSRKDTAEADEEGSKLTDTEIKALFLNLFTAGTDTTSITVEWAIAELISHPDILARVRDEIDSVVGKDRPVNEVDLNQMTYLRAVIKETFRLHPPTPLSLPRVAAEDCEINGYRVPKGSTLLVDIWAIARDPDSWSDPLVFNPGRFLPGGEKAGVDVTGNDYELIPFGAGRRVCAGKSLGIRMVQLLTATLVHAFDWELVSGQMPEKLNMDETYGQTLHRAEPLWLHPKPRLSKHVYNASA